METWMALLCQTVFWNFLIYIYIYIYIYKHKNAHSAAFPIKYSPCDIARYCGHSFGDSNINVIYRVAHGN